MKYLEKFYLPSRDSEADYILSYHHKIWMECYSDNIYPFNIFPDKELTSLSFSPITIFCGSNGSGKSTLLNVIAEKLGVERSSPFNYTTFFEEYLKLCDYESTYSSNMPRESRIITSDDVFDMLLDFRSLNLGVDEKREELFDEYYKTRKEEFRLSSLDDYEELKRHLEAKKKTKSAYVSKRLPKNISSKSNGESAYAYFTKKIPENALCLLDEPENSLSVMLQKELAAFVYDSARFFGTQFIISTHSPFFLSLEGATVYDLDCSPVAVRRWSEVEAMRTYFDFFQRKKADFN